MSHSKRNETRKTGLAFCRASGSEGATKHHLNLQERHILKTARQEKVIIKRVVKMCNQRVTLPALMEYAKDVDVLYITSGDRLTRSYVVFTNMVDKLKAMGVEMRVTSGKPDSIIDDLLKYMYEERLYWMRRELQIRVQKHRKTC